MVRTATRPLASFRSALPLALVLVSVASPASAQEAPPGSPAVEVAPARSSGATKGTIAGGFFGAIAGTMLAASMERRDRSAHLMFEGGYSGQRSSSPTPVHRLGLGLAVTAFGAILGRTIGATSDRRAAAPRHGDAGSSIDQGLRDLRAESVPAPTPGGVSCRTSTGS